MRVPLLLLRNGPQATAVLREIIGIGRPATCPRCNRALATVRDRYGSMWLGLLECPGCRAQVVYRKD